MAWPDDKSFLDDPTDPTTNTQQLGARVYDPTLGRFLTVDPILETGDPQALNGYSYADTDPMNHSDRTGPRPSCLDQASCAGSSNAGGAFTLTYTPPPGNSTPGNCGPKDRTWLHNQVQRAAITRITGQLQSLGYAPGTYRIARNYQIPQGSKRCMAMADTSHCNPGYADIIAIIDANGTRKYLCLGSQSLQ